MNHCLNCGGLIVGRTGTILGYSGKICYCPIGPTNEYQRPASNENYKERGYHSKTEMKRIESLKDARIKDLEQDKAMLNALINAANRTSEVDFRKIKELEEQNKILREALDDCLSWMQADHEWSECRNDEDCDHCLGLQIIESTKQALVRVSSSKTLFEKVSEGGEV